MHYSAAESNHLFCILFPFLSASDVGLLLYLNYICCLSPYVLLTVD